MAINIQSSDEPSQPAMRHTGGGFPPAGAHRVPRESEVELKGNDTHNPVSTGKGGLKASLRVKHAGYRDAPGVEKTNSNF